MLQFPHFASLETDPNISRLERRKRKMEKKRAAENAGEVMDPAAATMADNQEEKLK